MNNNDLQTLIVQLLRKLDETNERLENLADREEQHQSEEENYLAPSEEPSKTTISSDKVVSQLA